MLTSSAFTTQYMYPCVAASSSLKCISFRSFSSGPAARARGLSPELWADVRSGPTRDDARWPSVPLPAARVSSVPESTQKTCSQSTRGFGST